MFHMSANGEPLVCKARPGNCPFGTEVPHFETRDQARKYFEGSHDSFTEELADDREYNAAERTVDYTPQQVLQKFNEEIRGRAFPLSGGKNLGEPGIILERLFGKEPDNNPLADLGTIELKTLKKSARHRPMSLGTMAMESDVRKLRDQYLGPNFQHNLKVDKWQEVGPHKYGLALDEKARKLRLVIAQGSTIVSSDDFYWDFSQLEKKVDEKLKHVAVATYDTAEDENGSSVTYENLHIGGFSRESLIAKLKSGEVSMEFRFSKGYGRTTLRSTLKSLLSE